MARVRGARAQNGVAGGGNPAAGAKKKRAKKNVNKGKPGRVQAGGGGVVKKPTKTALKKRKAGKKGQNVAAKGVAAVVAKKDTKKAKAARMKLLSQPNTDARDLLAMKAKTMGDARQKLQQIRGQKQGHLAVKTTTNGAITITKTKKGKLVLTTKRKEDAKKGNTSRRPRPGAPTATSRGATSASRPRGAGRQRIPAPAVPVNPPRARGSGGIRKESRRPLQTDSRRTAAASAVARVASSVRRASGGGGGGGGTRQQPAGRRMTAADMLDDELMRTRVDRADMHRTLRQSAAANPRRQSPPRYVPTRTLPPASPRRYRERSRSPEDYRMNGSRSKKVIQANLGVKGGALNAPFCRTSASTAASTPASAPAAAPA